MLSLDNVLFIDTESNPDTGQAECVQILYKGVVSIIEDFSPAEAARIKAQWNEAEAVIMFNAPYDMGRLSTLFNNSYKWQVDKGDEGVKTAAWKISLFGNTYKVRRIGGHRNLIKPFNREKTSKHKGKGTKSTPVIDMLKLWSILIESGDDGVSIGLKSILQRHFNIKAQKYTPEISKTEAYRALDVTGLKLVTQLFLDRVENVLNLGSYNWEQWGNIKSPATFTKASYEERYPLKQWREENEDLIGKYNGLELALEKAYKGGITLSMHRGKVFNTGWVDIKSAYANTIKHFNTDRFLKFGIIKHEGNNWDFKKTNCLLQVKHNFCLESVNKSLKMFAVEEPCLRWVWYDDIQASKNFYSGYEYEVLGGFEFIPQNPCNTSLVEEWVRAKEEKGLKKKNITLYNYYKFLSNTSYGIKAQRQPFRTTHTNMVIAGMITANVHRILSIINHTIEGEGHTPKYNDTDSCCFQQSGEFTDSDMEALLKKINENIYPYLVEGEGYNKTTTFLSLKRYISEGGTDKDKVRLHGRGRYTVSGKQIENYVKFKIIPDEPLKLGSFAANTQLTLNMFHNHFPQYEEIHPFIFRTDIPCDRSMEDFFNNWYAHIDTKTSYPEGVVSEDMEFKREFRKFDSLMDAYIFFGEKVQDDSKDDMHNFFVDWDAEAKEDFTTAL